MRYRFRELSFDVADELVDQSMIVLVDEDRVALTLAREPRGGALSSYVDEAVQELGTSMSGYQLASREARVVAGCHAIVLEHAALSPEGRAVTQRQAYLEVGGDVLVLTATSPTEHAQQGRDHFDRVLASLAVD